MKDAHGLELSTDSAAAVAACDHLIDGFQRYRADLPQRLAALLATALELGLAHGFQGYMMMLGYKATLLPAARAAAATARRPPATGRTEAAQKMLDGMHATSNRSGTTAGIVATYALPVSDAVRLHGEGRYNTAVDRMLPMIGGSYTQQDVLEQLFLNAANSAGRQDVVRLVTERVAARRPMPLARQVGWQAAGRLVGC